VGSRTGGIVDVIEDGRTGRLVAPGDTEGLRTAIESLLADPDLRRDMGEAARRVALGRFDVLDSVERYRSLFREVASRSGAWSAPPSVRYR